MKTPYFSIGIVAFCALYLITSACSNKEVEKAPVKQGTVQVAYKSCGERMYELGDMIQNMHYLGYSRRSATLKLNELSNSGHGGDDLSSVTAIVWSKPSDFWNKGQVGSMLRDEAIRQGCK